MTSTMQFGLTPSGFVPKSQQQIIGEMQADLRSAFGATINLGDQSYFGQITGIVSERQALLWQAIQAVYAGQFPDGAEGNGVDAILALSGMKRLEAQPTVTNPNPATQSNGITLYGLVLYGTPGKKVTAGSLIQSNTTPSYAFTLDADVVISGAANAVQNLVMSNAPGSGFFTLGLVDAAGNRLVSPPLQWFTRATQTMLFWPQGSAPTTGTYRAMVDGTLTAAIDATNFASALSAINTTAGLSATGSATVVGLNAAAYNIQFPGYAPVIDANPFLLAQATVSAPSGTYNLVVGSVSTQTLAANATPAQVQKAIAALGYPQVAVVSASGGLAISFGAYGQPTLGVGVDNTNLALSVRLLNASAPTVANCLQASIAGIYDGPQRPFSDVVVTQSGQLFQITFGGQAPQTGQPSSAAITLPAISIISNNLGASGVFTTLTVAVASPGNPAQGIGSATCTQEGDVEVVAGQLSVIGSPTTGWTGVTNQLDCITGRDDEDDTTALARRSARLAGNAVSPLRALTDKVGLLPGVTSAVPFENTSQAALQNLRFSAAPATGSTFQLVLGSGTTGNIAADTATAPSIQAALNALPAYSTALVSGSLAFGFSFDFATSSGGQAQPLMAVTNNNTGVAITPSFGRSPGSFELVVAGGLPSQIAQTIYLNRPAGVSAYASPSAVTTGNVASGSSQVVVASVTGIAPGLSVFGRGIPNGASVLSVSGLTVTLSQSAIGDYLATTLVFNASVLITDEAGNPQLIGFSRPSPVLFYVSVSLITDQYRSPGVPSSGANPQSQWSAASIPTIQQEIVDIGNAVPVGGIVVGAGTHGIVGCFNDVPGVIGYTLFFGYTTNPTNTAPVQMLPTQQPLFETNNIVVTYV